MNHSPSATYSLAGSPGSVVHSVQTTSPRMRDGGSARPGEIHDSTRPNSSHAGVQGDTCCMDVDKHDAVDTIGSTVAMQRHTSSDLAAGDVASTHDLWCDEGSVDGFMEAAACGVGAIHDVNRKPLHVYSGDDAHLAALIRPAAHTSEPSGAAPTAPQVTSQETVRLKAVGGPDPHIGIPIRIAHLELVALLDSGAAVSLIHALTLEAVTRALRQTSPELLEGPDYLGRIEPETRLTLRLAGGDGQKLKPLGRTYLPIVLGTRLVVHPFLILDSLIHDMIIGCDLLVQVGIVVDFPNKRVQLLDGADVPVVLSRPVEPQVTKPVHLLHQHVTLKPRALTPVCAHIHTKGDLSSQEGHFWPSSSLQRTLGIMAPNALVSVRWQHVEPALAHYGPAASVPSDSDKDIAVISILLLNPTDQELVLTQETQLGTWMPATFEAPISPVLPTLTREGDGTWTADVCTW